MSIVRFGAFEADLDTGELRKRGLKIRLPGQVFQVLTLLLERPGEAVSRLELQQRLWPEDTFVDFDHGLNKAVNRLRDALSDSAGNPRFVETVAKRGYRLIVPVTGRTPVSSKDDLTERLRLAVLPFENLSADPEQEFFSDGLTEEMISELGRLNSKRLGVIARTSAMLYKHSNKRIDEIGRELDVDYILEGSVRRADMQLRITAQLIQVRDQTHLWAENYSRELADIFQVQHEVAQRVASSLAFELLPTPAREAVPPDAHEPYLRGRFFWNKGGDANAWTAVECFQKAIDRYPEYALAYSAMADAYGTLAWFSALAPRDAAAKAKAAALRALELDDRLAEAHCSLALVRFWFDWNWTEAEEEFRRSIALKPGYAVAHNWYAAYLNVMGRFAEAATEQKIGEEWDPLSLMIAMNRADPYYFSRQYDLAIENLLRVLRREPNFYPARYNLGRAYVQSGRYMEAIEAFRTAARLSGVPQANTALAYAYGVSGDAAQACAIQAELEQVAVNRYIPAPQMAWISLGLGDADAALEKLRQGFEEGSSQMIYLRADPIYDPLRAHPEFEELLSRMNFR